MLEQKLYELGLAPLYGQHCPLAPGEIQAVEQFIGFTLPDDYKEFISEYGCAHFEDGHVMVRSVEAPPEDLSDSEWLDFSVFLGACEQYKLARKVEFTRGRMPDTVIPIACDYGGNLFCLGVGGEDRGKVYVWDFHNEPDARDYLDEGLPVPERLMYSNMGLVAHSFTDFVLQMEARDVGD
jgi:hypothetical protein